MPAKKNAPPHNPPDPRILAIVRMVQEDTRTLIPVVIPEDYRADTFRGALWRHLPKVYRFSVLDRIVYVRRKG